MVVTGLLKPSQSRGPCKGSLEPDAREEDVNGRRDERLSSLMHGDRLHSCHGLLLPDLAAGLQVATCRRSAGGVHATSVYQGPAIQAICGPPINDRIWILAVEDRS